MRYTVLTGNFDDIINGTVRHNYNEGALVFKEADVEG